MMTNAMIERAIEDDLARGIGHGETATRLTLELLRLLKQRIGGLEAMQHSNGRVRAGRDHHVLVLAAMQSWLIEAIDLVDG